MLRAKAREVILAAMQDVSFGSCDPDFDADAELLLSALESAGLRFEEEGEEMETLTLTPFTTCDELRDCHVWMKDEADKLKQWERGEWGYCGRSYELRLPASAWVKAVPQPIPVQATEVK